MCVDLKSQACKGTRKRPVIHIRKTISIVRGKHDPKDETKTKEDRDFPIEDPALERLLQKLWSPDKKQDDFVFQEPNGDHVDRNRFYYSWRGKPDSCKLKSGTEGRYLIKGVVPKLADLGEEKGGIDHYRPQYATRHTFISLAVEGMIELNDSDKERHCNSFRLSWKLR